MKPPFRAAALALAFTLACHPAVAQSDADKARAAQDAERLLHEDWANMTKYRAANAALPPAAAAHPRIVFLGDSITQGWYDKMPGFFVDGRVGRGIGGQTTPQMLVRFRQDVVDLHPAAVHIMAGTNDIAGNTGPMAPEQTKDVIRSMADLARANGIRVILASIPPSDHFAWRPGLDVAPRIEAMNGWLKDYAAQIGATYADYWAVLHDGHAERSTLTYDGVHPNEAGYVVMSPVALASIKASLAKPAPRGLKP